MGNPNIKPGLSMADLIKSTRRGDSALRIVLYGPPHGGKTSFIAGMPQPLVLQIGGETGLDDLRTNRIVPHEIASPHITSWLELIGTLENIAKAPRVENFQTIVCESATTMERLLVDHVIASEFGGDPGEKGFSAYSRGWKSVGVHWNALIACLQSIHSKHNVHLVITAHEKHTKINNPEGRDYTRITPALRDETWAPLYVWASEVLRLTFKDSTISEDGFRKDKPVIKGLRTGGKERMIYTTRTSVWDAKTRSNIPDTIPMPDEPLQMWPTFWKMVLEGRDLAEKGQGPRRQIRAL